MKTVIAFSLISFIVFLAFMPSLGNSFINLDDYRYVVENPVIKSLSPANVKKIFTSFFIGNYQPLTVLSYALDYRLFRLDPAGYRITSLVLHLLNCLLVMWLVRTLSGRIDVAFITALLFGVHPMRVESVVWISERKDVLYALFFLGSAVSYCYYLVRGRLSKFYYLSVFLFVLSLLAKPMAVSLPLVLVLVDYVVRRGREKNVFSDKIPFLLLSAAFGVIALFSQGAADCIRPDRMTGFSDRLLMPIYCAIFYLKKLFMPLKLSILYPNPAMGTDHLLLAAPVIFAGLVLAVYFSRNFFSRKLAFAFLFYLAVLLPVIQIIPVGITACADRYTYIASIGIFYALSEGFVWLYSRKTRRGHIFRRPVLVVLALLVGMLFFLTGRECLAWKDSLTLWNHVLGNYPNFAKALNLRGAEFVVNKEYDKAMADFKQAIMSSSSDSAGIERADYYLNLANLYLSLGRIREGTTAVNKAYAIDPNCASVHLNLANVHYYNGRKEDAILSLKRAIEIDPAYLKAYDNLGAIYNNIGRREEAAAAFKKAIEIDPDFVPAYAKLAYLYEASGRREDAILLYEKAVKRDLEFYEAYLNLGNLYRERGARRDAVRMYRKALQLDPDSAEARDGLIAQ